MRRSGITGLSPRGRGNPRTSQHPITDTGSIPAWAGEPGGEAPALSPLPVYPRVGGGTPYPRRARGSRGGLSPRGRGNPRPGSRSNRVPGSIPAWAGEPHGPPPVEPTPTVYPRVGGGTLRNTRAVNGRRGLSPRGRGNRTAVTVSSRSLRSIPAWAGEPLPPLGNTTCHQVYPRVGGGTLRNTRAVNGRRGLSPRGRGNRTAVTVSSRSLRSIPAWAGEPLPPLGNTTCHQVYPRVGGGTLPSSKQEQGLVGLSPRGRGNLVAYSVDSRRKRSIPAWAGEPLIRDVPGAPEAVYPRVGGGTFGWVAFFTLCTGLSPRGRGNLVEMPGRPHITRSIPAWAGEPSDGWHFSRSARVYPRVGGGTLSRCPVDPTSLGLSPRGRGNQPLTLIPID